MGRMSSAGLALVVAAVGVSCGVIEDRTSIHDRMSRMMSTGVGTSGLTATATSSGGAPADAGSSSGGSSMGSGSGSGSICGQFTSCSSNADCAHSPDGPNCISCPVCGHHCWGGPGGGSGSGGGSGGGSCPSCQISSDDFNFCKDSACYMLFGACGDSMPDGSSIGSALICAAADHSLTSFLSSLSADCIAALPYANTCIDCLRSVCH